MGHIHCCCLQAQAQAQQSSANLAEAMRRVKHAFQQFVTAEEPWLPQLLQQLKSRQQGGEASVLQQLHRGVHVVAAASLAAEAMHKEVGCCWRGGGTGCLLCAECWRAGSVACLLCAAVRPCWRRGVQGTRCTCSYMVP